MRIEFKDKLMKNIVVALCFLFNCVTLVFSQDIRVITVNQTKNHFFLIHNSDTLYDFSANTKWNIENTFKMSGSDFHSRTPFFSLNDTPYKFLVNHFARTFVLFNENRKLILVIEGKNRHERVYVYDTLCNPFLIFYSVTLKRSQRRMLIDNSMPPFILIFLLIYFNG